MEKEPILRKIGRKWEVVIPAEIRKALRLPPTGLLAMWIDNGTIVMRPIALEVKADELFIHDVHSRP